MYDFANEFEGTEKTDMKRIIGRDTISYILQEKKNCMYLIEIFKNCKTTKKMH